VGCDKVLTAAHCIARDPRPQQYLVFFQEAGIFEVTDIKWPANEYKYPYADLALLTLARPVAGIAPIALNFSTSPPNNFVATIIGYGRTGGSRRDFGIKREGSVVTEPCPATLARNKLLCWRFDADVKSDARPSNTCNGDSGGGVLMRGKEAGAASRKSSASCPAGATRTA